MTNRISSLILALAFATAGVGSAFAHDGIAGRDPQSTPQRQQSVQGDHVKKTASAESSSKRDMSSKASDATADDVDDSPTYQSTYPMDKWWWKD